LGVAVAAYARGWALLALARAPVSLVLAKVSGRGVTRRTLPARRATAALTVYISERMTGLRIIRAFGRAAPTVAAVAELATAQADAELAATRLTARLQPVYAILTTGGVVAVVWAGGD